jgi:SAM-dependent methyltransferase
MRYFLERIKSAFVALDRLRFIEHAVLESMGPLERFCALSASQEFSSHYQIWRVRRIQKILECYGINWQGKKVVELAAGYGEISGFFAALGADVTCVEGRVHNLNIARLRLREFNNITFVQRNLEEDFSDLGRFDLAIHFGLLYHIRNIKGNLCSTARLADDIVLETEVVDSLDPKTVITIEQDKRHRDRSLEGQGSRCSPFYIKEFFQTLGFDVEIITDPFLNVAEHHYSWEHKNDGSSRDGLRRFFRISKR